MQHGGENSLMKCKIMVSALLALIVAVPSLAGVGFEYLLYEDFESISPPDLPPGWVISNPGGDAGMWETRAYGGLTWGRQCIRYRGDAMAVADDWFFTSGIDLAPGELAHLRFMTRLSSIMQVYNLEVWVGTGQDPADMTDLIGVAAVGDTAYTEELGGFVATEANTYYFGFHCSAPPNPYRLFVDDLIIETDELELELGIGIVKSLFEDPPIFTAGDDTISVFVYLKNTGGTAKTMNTRFAVGKWPSDTEIEFVVDYGGFLPLPILNMFDKSRPAGPGDFEYLQPDSTAGKVVNLWNWYPIDMTGDYFVYAIYRNQSDPDGLGAWTGHITSDTIIITVE